jgi:quinol-cytochrome oxidoreductase complex cytochrome b subunit
MDSKTPPSQSPPRREGRGTPQVDGAELQVSGVPAGAVAVPPPGRLAGLSEQLGLDWLGAGVRTFLIPVKTTSVWMMLGGLLGVAIALEFLTGIMLLFPYKPDALGAYQSTSDMMANPFWSIVLGVHYFLMYLIFGLVMLHFMRVFISGAYRGVKKAQWQLGVALSVLVFGISATGETLHWDERGMAIPWHVGESFEALRLQHVFDYVHRNLITNLDFATSKILQMYVLHIVVLPVLILVAMALHYHVVRRNGISVPFWQTARRGAISVRDAWARWYYVVFGVVFIISVAVQRTPGPAAQGLPSSPFPLSGDPGGLGTVPTIPISWTHGLNRFVTIAFDWRPDIWGTLLGSVIMIGALVLVPVVDRMRGEPRSWREAFDLRRRGLAFGLIAVFWLVMIIGLVTDVASPIG